MARWTTDWDCGYETGWWYVIKDEPFDISGLKAKRRYEITKGSRNFDVLEIDTSQYVNELLNIVQLAYNEYPITYRPIIEEEKFIESMKNSYYYRTYGAFSKENGKLCGYVQIDKKGAELDLCMLKAIPEHERLGINAAMIYKVLCDFSEHLETGHICDGQRNLYHETAFQDYLEKYFGFRKAYCKLHIQYRKGLDLVMRVLQRGQVFIDMFGNSKLGHMLIALIKMDEIARERF